MLYGNLSPKIQEIITERGWDEDSVALKVLGFAEEMMIKHNETDGLEKYFEVCRQDEIEEAEEDAGKY